MSPDESAVVVSGAVPNENLTQIVPIVDQLDARLNAVRVAHPGYGVALPGLSLIAARDSAGMIGALNRALTIEFVFVAAFIGFAFRSLAIRLAVLPSGVFPVVAAGSLLRLTGHGLQFAAVIALTVSFGLGLSATIHSLNRMARQCRLGEDPALAVEKATVLIGPALTLTAFVLACRLEALAFSSLPALRLFGWLCAFAMLAAVVGDLLILRPVVAFLLRLSRRDALVGLRKWRRP